MTLPDLMNYLNQGREIELSIDGQAFFLSPIYSQGISSGEYGIYDNQKQCCIFAGSKTEILEYQFFPDVSFSKALYKFSFDYVL